MYYTFVVLICLALFLALFIMSVVADRTLVSDLLTQWLFGLSLLPLYGAISTFIAFMIIGDPPSEVLEISVFDYLKWVASKYGGWSPAIAVMYLEIAGTMGVMYLLSNFVDAVESEIYGGMTILFLVIGIVILVGFFVFLDAVALILGIIGTIIGIIIGLKKLSSRTSI